jgi:hypothetical protein
LPESLHPAIALVPDLPLQVSLHPPIPGLPCTQISSFVKNLTGGLPPPPESELSITQKSLADLGILHS